LPNTVNFGEVRKSIRELTRIYKPKNPERFIQVFIRKYKVQKGFEKELLADVLDELNKMKLSQ
jgi:hypothetical protein